MTTITIKQDIQLSKQAFESLEDLRVYLLEELEWEKLETVEFYSELDRRAISAMDDRSKLKSVQSLRAKLNELK